VWIVIRHSPTGSLTHSHTYDFSNPEQRRIALNKVFALDNLGSGEEAIETMALNKKSFLTSGNLSIPEAPNVEELIYDLQTSLKRLYRVFDLAGDLKTVRNRFALKLNSDNIVVTAPGDLYSFFNMNELKGDLTKIVEDARSVCNSLSGNNLAREARQLQSAIDELKVAEESSLIEFPDYEAFSQAFARAINAGGGGRPEMASIDYQERFPAVASRGAAVHQSDKSLASKYSRSSSMNLLQTGDGSTSSSAGRVTRQQGQKAETDQKDGENTVEEEDDKPGTSK
jgi:hypothetical protein